MSLNDSVLAPAYWNMLVARECIHVVNATRHTGCGGGGRCVAYHRVSRAQRCPSGQGEHTRPNPRSREDYGIRT